MRSVRLPSGAGANNRRSRRTAQCCVRRTPDSMVMGGATPAVRRFSRLPGEPNNNTEADGKCVPATTDSQAKPREKMKRSGRLIYKNTNDSVPAECATPTLKRRLSSTLSGRDSAFKYYVFRFIMVWSQILRLAMLQVVGSLLVSCRLSHDLAFGELRKLPGDDFYRATISAEDTVKMYSKWLDTGISSLFSAIANRR